MMIHRSIQYNVKIVEATLFWIMGSRKSAAKQSWPCERTYTLTLQMPSICNIIYLFIIVNKYCLGFVSSTFSNLMQV